MRVIDPRVEEVRVEVAVDRADRLVLVERVGPQVARSLAALGQEAVGERAQVVGGLGVGLAVADPVPAPRRHARYVMRPPPHAHGVPRQPLGWCGVGRARPRSGDRQHRERQCGRPSPPATHHCMSDAALYITYSAVHERKSGHSYALTSMLRARPRLLAVAAALAAGLAVSAHGAPGHPLSAPSLMGDVETYAGLAPDHLSGTANSGATQAWMARQLRAAGLKTGADAFSFYRFTPHTVALEADGQPVPGVAPRLYSGTTPADGLAAPFAYAGQGTAQQMSSADVKGKIAVVDVPYSDGATAPTLEPAITNAKAAGARALVEVTEGPEDYPVHEDVDSRAGLVGLPVIFTGKRSGGAVIDAAKAGRAGRLTLTA